MQECCEPLGLPVTKDMVREAVSCLERTPVVNSFRCFDSAPVVELTQRLLTLITVVESESKTKVAMILPPEKIAELTGLSVPRKSVLA